METTSYLAALQTLEADREDAFQMLESFVLDRDMPNIKKTIQRITRIELSLSTLSVVAYGYDIYIPAKSVKK